MPLRLWNRKTPELRETTVTHNSVFAAAAHRQNAGSRVKRDPAFPFWPEDRGLRDSRGFFRVARASRVLVSASRRNDLEKVREPETASPTRETRALPNPWRQGDSNP